MISPGPGPEVRAKLYSQNSLVLMVIATLLPNRTGGLLSTGRG